MIARIQRRKRAEDVKRRKVEKPPEEEKLDVAAEAAAARAQISVAQLIQEGLLKPGNGAVMLAHKDMTFFANLLATGQIQYEGHIFDTPGEFYTHIKQPIRKGDPAADGFRCVHVEGISLEDWRHRLLAQRKAAEAGEELKPMPVLAPHVVPEPLGPEELPPLASANDVNIPISLEAAKSVEEAAEEEDADEPDTSNWVQCSRCQTWRLVPDEFWPDIENAEDEDWFCNEATWDLTQWEPYTEACKVNLKSR